jgi:DNA-binding response OmpR family regulator
MNQDIENEGRILVADDEKINVEFFDIMLSKLGFTVDRALDGEEVLQRVADFPPDLLLLDLLMPKIDGFEVVSKLKESEDTRDLPIIVLTAVDEVDKKVDLLELGIDDYIIKPFNFIEILARIRSVLRQKKLREKLDVVRARCESPDLLVEQLETFIESARKDSRRIVDYFEEMIARTDEESDDMLQLHRLGKNLLENIEHLGNRCVELKG